MEDEGSGGGIYRTRLCCSCSASLPKAGTISGISHTPMRTMPAIGAHAGGRGQGYGAPVSIACPMSSALQVVKTRRNEGAVQLRSDHATAAQHVKPMTNMMRPPKRS